MNRKGEKIGWIAGWIGAFVWLAVLATIWLFQHKIGYGLIGITVFAAAIITIFAAAPWKHPYTKYWKLMLPIYLLFFMSSALCIDFYGGFGKSGLKWAGFLWILPCLSPLVTIGRRTWKGNTKNLP